MITTNKTYSLIPILDAAIDARSHLFDSQHVSAQRIFSGFYEGFPELSIDVFAHTVVFHNYADPPESIQNLIETALDHILSKLPWIKSAIIKAKKAQSHTERAGIKLLDCSLDYKVREHRIWYAIDLQINQDTSFFLDTRSVRAWALKNLSGKTVLNTFAYTGSFGVAAAAAGAKKVINTDKKKDFLNLSKLSYNLNGLPIENSHFRTSDFFSQVSQIKRTGELFDCVFLDPPYFSVTAKGTIDMASNSRRVINKVRPLVEHNGYLLVINNALFLKGSDYMDTLHELCADGYLSVETIIPVPADTTGYKNTIIDQPPVDPAPFNHPTKITVLRVRRK